MIKNSTWVQLWSTGSSSGYKAWQQQEGRTRDTSIVYDSLSRIITVKGAAQCCSGVFHRLGVTSSLPLHHLHSLLRSKTEDIKSLPVIGWDAASFKMADVSTVSEEAGAFPALSTHTTRVFSASLLWLPPVLRKCGKTARKYGKYSPSVRVITCCLFDIQVSRLLSVFYPF